jgi:plastocyanin
VNIRHTSVSVLVAAAVLSAAGLAVMNALGGTQSARVTVTETEYKITLSRTHIATGKTTFVVVNKGKLAHSLSIRGPGMTKRLIMGTIAPGSSHTAAVTLKSGTFTLWCPVDSHAKLGMKTTLKVGAGTSGGSSWG